MNAELYWKNSDTLLNILSELQYRQCVVQYWKYSLGEGKERDLPRDVPTKQTRSYLRGVTAKGQALTAVRFGKSYCVASIAGRKNSFKLVGRKDGNSVELFSLQNQVTLLQHENTSLRNTIVALQSEVSGAKLTAKYLDKELAGRIQQLQLLGREMRGEEKDKLWRQLEAEILLQRHKTGCASLFIRPLSLSSALALAAPPTLSTAWTAPQSMFFKPSVTSSPLYSAPMRILFLLARLAATITHVFTRHWEAPFFSHWTRRDVQRTNYTTPEHCEQNPVATKQPQQRRQDNLTKEDKMVMTGSQKCTNPSCTPGGDQHYVNCTSCQKPYHNLCIGWADEPHDNNEPAYRCFTCNIKNNSSGYWTNTKKFSTLSDLYIKHTASTIKFDSKTTRTPAKELPKEKNWHEEIKWPINKSTHNLHHDTPNPSRTAI
uniref:Uncharacterized protein n=1 Tax=Timema bartmani TaxID=61472 RepID=A0A7R9I387_9NEOP|nr:unnamed protein product [Timema bartmani]